VLLDQLVVAGGVDVLGVAGRERDLLAAELLVLNQDVEDLAHVDLHVESVFAGHGSGQRLPVQISSDAHAHGEGGQAEGGEVEVAVLGDAFDSA